MNAKEAMQALLDGKTIRNKCVEGCMYKLDDEGNLLISSTNGWKLEPRYLLSNMEVIEEYPLTFEQALREMLDGKVVEVERLDFKPRFPHRFNRELSCFEFYSTSEGKWWMTHISECEQICKWKVVE